MKRLIRTLWSFIKEIVRAQRQTYRNSDRIDRFCLAVSWTFMVVVLLMVPIPNLSLPIWSFLPFLGICLFAMIRGWLGFRREMALFDRLYALHKTGGSEADLPPADQEWLNAVRARRVLRGGPRSDPGD